MSYAGLTNGGKGYAGLANLPPTPRPAAKKVKRKKARAKRKRKLPEQLTYRPDSAYHPHG